MADNSNAVQQNFYAAVENVASRDIVQYNITSVRLLHGLETAVKHSDTIPEPQKSGLRHQLRTLAENPYVSGLATSAIFEGLKAVMMQGQ